MRTRLTIFATIMLLVLALPLAQAAQELNGLAVIQTALDLANENCDQLSRNQACYGHDLLSADPRPGANPFSFTAEGDVEDLAKIQSLRLSGLDINAGTWGVAMMHLRANLPATHPQNVTLVAFGDVHIENAVLPPTQAEIEVQTTQYLNVRYLPTTSARVVGTLAPRQTVTVVERLEDASWLRVVLPESDETGWIMADFVSSATDLSSLNVAASDAPYIQEPMQAFYFSSSESDSASFARIPENGLLIQTPEGVGEVQLLINEINVQLGSTVFFQAQPGNIMTIHTLEGHADIRAFGIEQTAYAGTQVTVPLNEDLAPSGPPSPPQPYDMAQMESLPTNVLERSIAVAAPMSYPEIQERQAAQQASTNQDDCPGNSCNTPGQGGGQSSQGGGQDQQNNNQGGGGARDCPGQSCNAPGQGGSCPGNSCNAPGQDGDDQSSPQGGPGDNPPGGDPPGNPPDGGSGGDDDDGGGPDNCPGQSCNAPGHGGSCPGNSCNAPGKNK